MDRRARAEQEAAGRGLTMVPPFDHEWIIAGQGRPGSRSSNSARRSARSSFLIGGGGLVAGVAAAIKLSNPSWRDRRRAGRCGRMKASLDAGHPVTLDDNASIADGLMPVSPGDLTFAHVESVRRHR